MDPLEPQSLPSTPADALSTPGRRRRTFPIVAWIVIMGLVGVIVAAVQLAESESAGPAREDRITEILMTAQTKLIIGASGLPGATSYVQAEMVLNVGSVSQRLRFVVVAAEMKGADQARSLLDELDGMIEEEIGRTAEGEEPFRLTEEQGRVYGILRELYAPLPDADADAESEPVGDAHLARLSDEQAAFLREQLGWVGELALAPAATSDRTARDAVLQPAQTLAIVMFAGFGLAALGGVAGFVGLVLLVIFAFLRVVRSGMPEGDAPHGIYAETFAVWLACFFGMQVVLELLPIPPGAGLAVAGLAFLVSLLALVWPVLRGVGWKAVRRDIGWTLGRQPLLEPLIGVGGYLMALPIVAVGLIATLILMQLAAGPADRSSLLPETPPAHPIVEQVASGNVMVWLQIYFVASIAAPIVEETMFRGVLYRHLRDATRRVGFIASFVLSGLVTSFVFAIVHPQGWLAAPALMSLAAAFVLLREWRGTVIPAVIVHGISNGIVMTLLITLLAGT